jgi:hypothetical protein
MYIAQPRGRLIEVYKLVPEIYSSRVGKRAKSRGDLFLLPPFPFPPFRLWGWNYFFVLLKSLSGPRKGHLHSGRRLLTASGQPSVVALIVRVPFHRNSPDRFFWYPLPGRWHPPPQAEWGILHQGPLDEL